MSAFLQFLDRNSRAVLAVLTLLFLTIETGYAIHRPLSLDEFNGAWSAAQLADGVPYRDFQPYKPVVGYYAQLALMRLAPDSWNGYVAVRLGTAYLSGTILFLGALWLRRLFRPDAVCLAYALLVVMTSLVEWAIEVRLDMPTALFGFVSLLLLLNRRVALAGVIAGAAFLISQKGTMYALAGGVALVGCLVVQRERRQWRDLLVYGACVVVPVSLYVLFWSLLASFPQVWARVFAEPTQLRALTTPAHGPTNFYREFWLETLRRNPLFYACALWAFVGLLARRRAQTPRETLLLFYGATVAVLMLNLRQPWAYSFVLLVPTLFVLHVDLFARELGRPDGLLRRPVAWLCCAVLGLFLPLSRLPVVARDDPGGQRQTLELTEALLEPGDRYFAGFSFLYRRDAHAQALPIVDANGARPVQDLTAAEHEAIVERFREEPVRVVIYTHKIDQEVPGPLRKHLHRNYTSLWGNVWIYAPQLKPADAGVNLLFTDRYTVEMDGPHAELIDLPRMRSFIWSRQVESAEPHAVLIDGQTYVSGESVELERGQHTIVTPVRLRLKLHAGRVAHLLKPAYRDPINFFWPDRGPYPPHARTGVWVDD